MRVFSATLATETNTFAPMPTGLQSYKAWGLFEAGRHPDRPTLFSGPLWAARQLRDELGLELNEGLVAFAVPGGTTTRHAHETLRTRLLDDLRAAMPVDVVLLGLHGAMVADGCDDCEGDLITRVREIVGPSVVIGAELDPHTHLTEAMVRNANLLMAFREYPHTDAVERGLELVRACVATARGQIHPVPAVYDCNTIGVVRTPVEPARSFVDRLKALEGRDGIVSITAIHGFPWADVADLGSKLLVYTDGDAGLAQHKADELGPQFKQVIDAYRDKGLGIDETLAAALAAPAGTVVIADGADNAGGGAPSDSTFILRRLIERDVQAAVLGPLWDPGAVALAFEAGEGATLPLRLGGKVAPVSGDPVDAEVRVVALRHAARQSGLSGSVDALGDCAVVAIGGVQVMLTTHRTQAFNTDLFTNMGVDLAAQRIVVVKSSQHFFASYSAIAVRVLYCNAPGTLASDLRTLPYRKARPGVIASF
ncbi:MAG: M81 family metallopeptidase [Burkholderiales bacterium]